MNDILSDTVAQQAINAGAGGGNRRSLQKILEHLLAVSMRDKGALPERIGSVTVDTSGSDAVYDTGLTWPTVAARDLYLIEIHQGAGVYSVQWVSGAEIEALSDGTAGSTALTAGTGIELWQRTSASAIREVGKIGKSASGDVLYDPEVTGAAATVVQLIRIPA